MEKKRIVTALAVALGLSTPVPALWAAHHEGSDAQAAGEAKPAEDMQQEAGAEGAAADQGTMSEGAAADQGTMSEGAAADQGTMTEGGEGGMAGQAEGSMSESSH